MANISVENIIALANAGFNKNEIGRILAGGSASVSPSFHGAESASVIAQGSAEQATAAAGTNNMVNTRIAEPAAAASRDTNPQPVYNDNVQQQVEQLLAKIEQLNPDSIAQAAAQNILLAQQPKEQTPEDMLAEIINPQGGKYQVSDPTTTPTK